MTSKEIRLVVGLGNPGDAYQDTRHNAGFLVLDRFAETYSVAMDKRKFDVVIGRGLVENHEVLLAKPQAYMNRSGPPVLKLSGYFRILPEEMLIVHDDIDLSFGRLKIKEKGGHGGHNGIRSLMEAFGDGNFARLRVGIGRSEEASVTDHVLGRFNAAENSVLDQIFRKVCDAIVTIIGRATREGMNIFHKKELLLDRIAGGG